MMPAVDLDALARTRPRAWLGKVHAGAARPAVEAALVLEAAVSLGMAATSKAKEPMARKLAQQVVAELATFIASDGDPLTAAFHELRGAAFATPAFRLATDPDVDTLSTYVDARTAFLRARNGRALSNDADQREHCQILGEVERLLTRRYLKVLRGGNVH